MEDKYKVILREIVDGSSKKINWREEDFYQEIVRDLFVKKMGYEMTNLSKKEKENTFQAENLLIYGFVEKKYERGFTSFIKRIKDNNCKWGILLHPEGMWLINLDIVPNGESDFTDSQVVLEIRYGVNTDQKYFRYFSAENTIGKRRNACFFRDIIDYKNNNYKGTEKSWPGYESALKRCFDFYVEYKGDYGQEENIYDSIKFPFFVKFINEGTKCRSLKSARNAFFYIKDFMQVKSENGEFEDPERIKKSFPEFLPGYKTQDVMCIDKLKVALKYLDKNKNGTRNKTILLFFLAYGMERRRLCALKWDNIRFESRRLEIGKKEYPVPGFLMEMLLELRKQGTSKEYVFCNSDGTALSDGAVNSILSGIAKVNVNDGFYSQLTPANIRRYLAKFLLAHDYPMQKIFYLMDIEGYKLESYISVQDINEVFWKESEDPVCCEVGQHPMENFLRELQQG